MPTLGEDDLVDEPVNPRWHLINLVPLWILQFVTSLVIGALPGLCFMSCGSVNTPIQTMASVLTFVCAITIAVEAYLFAVRALTPAKNATAQSVKFLAVAGQIGLVVRYDSRGQYAGEGSWVAWILVALMIAICCLPFSAHLLYAMIAYKGFPSRSWRVKFGNLGQSRVALLNEGEAVDHRSPIPSDVEQLQSPFSEAMEWPRIGRLFPIWTLQLIYPLFLCFVSIARMGSGYSESLPRDIVTYLAVGSSISITIFEIFSSCYKACRLLLIHTYVRLQILKVGIIYLLLSLVVLSEGGFKLKNGGWAGSLMAVFIMSIPFGSPFIAELVYAGIEY